MFFQGKLLYEYFFKDKISATSDIYECMQKYDTNQIYEFPHLLSDKECDKIIELSRDKVKRSTVISGSQKNDISEVRTSSNTFLSNSVDPLMKYVGVGLLLSDDEKANLKTFLLTLSDEDFIERFPEATRYYHET